MNICIVSTYSCTFDQFKERADQSMEEAKAFMSDYELVKVHDMEKMRPFMTKPELQDWSKA